MLTRHSDAKLRVRSWVEAAVVLCVLAVITAGAGCIASGAVVDVFLAGDAIVGVVAPGHRVVRGVVIIAVVLVGACIILFTFYVLLMISVMGVAGASEEIGDATDARVSKVRFVLVLPGLGGLVLGALMPGAIVGYVEAESGVWWGITLAALVLFVVWMTFVLAGMGVLGSVIDVGVRYRRRTAASAGDPDAMYQLAREMRRLAPNNADKRKAERWYRLAAQTGHQDAMVSLAHLLKTQGDPIEAEIWFRKAAQHGDQGAMWELANLLQTRGGSAEAQAWLQRAEAPHQEPSGPESIPERS